MSVVINVLFNGKSYLMSDGRARCATTHEIKSENQPKIVMISDEIAVGYTGTLEFAELMLKNYLILKNKHDISSFDRKFNLLNEIAKCLYSDRAYRISFLMSGMAEDGLMKTYTSGSSVNFQVQKLVCNQAIQLIEIGSDAIDFNAYMNAFLPTAHGSVESKIMQTMQRYIKAVADRDDTVNTNITRIILPNQGRTNESRSCG